MDLTDLVADGSRWPHLGAVVMPRGPAGSFDSAIVGDPCIVWDDDENRWRMFYFAVGESYVGTGMALSRSSTGVDAGDWTKCGPLPMEGALASASHKFWVLMDPLRPGHAVRIGGKLLGFFTTFDAGAKIVGRAHALRLGGPWRTDDTPVIAAGGAGDFDARGADAVTAYWFAAQNRIAVFYMAYPGSPQPQQPTSPIGPCQAVAVLAPSASEAEKLGPILRPGGTQARWCGGWIGGLQLLPSTGGSWIALLNGSPTPVHDGHGEPDPSVAGWARCDRAFPTSGWTLDSTCSPIEHPDDLTADAKQAGESTNFWRHYLLRLPDGRIRMYYNSGEYGCEQIYARRLLPR